MRSLGYTDLAGEHKGSFPNHGSLEVKDFGRGLPACVDGDLREALVDKHRNPSMIYKYFCDAWKNARIITEDKERYEYTPLGTLDKTPLCCKEKTDEKEA